MDLRRWFADSGASGAEQEALDRAFRHQEGRFANDRPRRRQPALRRQPSAAATQGRRGSLSSWKTAFRGIDRREAVWDVLLDGVNTDERHRGADEEAFRLTYPFSPALVSTLRSLASVMQRERTALKVMQQMLVDRRDTLTIDEVLPVGDSFDLVVQGQTGQALDPQAAALFRSANKLYTEKLRPLLLAHPQPRRASRRRAARDRAAGLPRPTTGSPRRCCSRPSPRTCPALKSLTAARLASLNHGSIVSPLPGGEAAARAVEDPHLGPGRPRDPPRRRGPQPDDPGPALRRRLRVDRRARQGRGQRGPAPRAAQGDRQRQPRRRARQPRTSRAPTAHEIVWRGSRRQVDLVFGNVRDRSWLSDDHFINTPGTWRVVIDHPFDDAGHSSAEDLQRLDDMLAKGFEARTIVWLPKFLSDDKITELRRLTILNWLLEGTGERWRTHADHLNEADRALARSILESQRNTLRRSLEDAVQQAYGAASPRPGVLLDEDGHDRVLISLDRSFAPANPVGATLSCRLRAPAPPGDGGDLPGHPAFEPGDVEVKVRDLKLVAAHVARAAADKEKRVDLQGDIATVRRVANPLGVGTATEMNYILGDDRFSPWGQEIERALGRREQEGGPEPLDPVTVAGAALAGSTPSRRRTACAPRWPTSSSSRGRRCASGPGSRTARRWATVPDPGQVTAGDGAADPADADRRRSGPAATAMAGALLGVNASAHLTAPAVADFVGKVVERASALSSTAPGLVSALETAYGTAGVAEGARLETARHTAELVQQLRHLSGVELVRAVAAADLGARQPHRRGPVARFGRRTSPPH